MKKQYFDARHNCFAYRIMSENVLIERQSDDGEPSKTAGFPILDCLKKNDLTDIQNILAHYFDSINMITYNTCIARYCIK